MALFRKLRKKYGISPAYVHCSYLINLSSGSAPTRARSAAMLREEMARADAVGAEFVILHLHGGKEERRMTVEGITEALRGGRFTSRLIIENTSRTKVSELAEVIDGAGGLVEGVCLDSCHAFAAGYDMRTGEGMDVLSREIRAHVGLRAVKLLHLNDSKGECGSGVDRHEHIGRGRVGTDGLKRYVDAFKNIPLVLETPRKGEEDDAANLAQVREMLAG
jgi:deoxyribonuclease-4